jgi:hypothetical protein
VTPSEVRSAVVVLATVLLGACSGAGEDALSEEQFRAQANAICERYDQDVEALGSPETEAEIRAHIGYALPILRRQIDELRELDPPGGDEGRFDTMIADLESSARAVEDMGASFEQEPVDDAAVADAFARANAAGNRSDEAAAAIGLDECVEAEEDE